MSEPILSVRGLTKHFPKRRDPFGRPVAWVHAVDGVDFDIARGEVLSLVGESGCGKSTTGRLALRLLEPTDGRIVFDGDDITGHSRKTVRRLRSRMQLIFQDPLASLNARMTVGQTLDEPFALHTAMPRADRTRRVAELLSLVGLRPEHADRFPHEFSGGQRQRICIARALASNPDFLVCDEAVSALDVSVQAQILNLLMSLQGRFGIAILFISHDLAVVRHISQRLAVMYLGQIVESARRDDLFTAPLHPYSRTLLAAVPGTQARTGDKRASGIAGDAPNPISPPSGCRFHPRCPFSIELCRTATPALEQADAHHSVACHRWRELPTYTHRSAPLRSVSHERLRSLQARFAPALT